MENNTKKELTLEDIAGLIKTSADETRKGLEEKIVETRKALEIKIDASAEEVASMTQRHFLSLEADIREVKADIKEVKADTEKIKTDMNKKVDVFKHNDLSYRVEKLEEKNGITFKKNLATA